MVVLGIDKVEYKVYESWSEITVKDARKLSDIANTIPDELAFIYSEQAKGEDADEDQILIYSKKLIDIEKDLNKFYSKVLFRLSDIPKGVINKINTKDLVGFYNIYLMPFVFGVLHFPLEKTIKLKKFTVMGETYHAPISKKIMGTVRPFYKEDVAVFCDASDADQSSRREGNKFNHAELIVATIFRKQGEKHTEDGVIERAEYFKDILTCDVYYAAISHLNSVDVVLKKLFPNMYEKGDSKAKMASEESGLSDFGWYNSLISIAEMGVLNHPNKIPLDSVRQSDTYEVMTVLSNLRATNDFQRIFRDKINKK